MNKLIFHYVLFVFLFFGLKISAEENILYFFLEDHKQISEVLKNNPNGYFLGIDPSQALVDLAQKTYRSKRADFKKGLLEEVLSEKKFQRIICLSKRLFSEQSMEVVRCWTPYLADKGQIYIKIPVRVPAALETSFRFVASQDKWKSQDVMKKLKTVFYEELPFLEEKQIRILEKKLVSREEIFSSTDDFYLFLERWAAMMGLNMEDNEEFIQEVLSKFLSIFPPDKNKNIHFFYEECELVLEKI
ncbi:MAG: hypothetical protein Tsb0015_11540 [Simkaniaceae bacterium]